MPGSGLSLQQSIASAVEQHRDEALALLQSLIRIPSLEGHEALCQDILEHKMRQMGLMVDRWCPSDDELRAHPAYVPTGKSYSDRPNTVGVLNGAGGGRSLILNGHVDVVPTGPEHLWQHGAWSGAYIDGRVYGRGSADMKGGVVANIVAAMALQTAGIRLRGSLIIENVVDEEAGGNGTLAAILRGYTGDACIFTEPTGLTRLAISNRGAQFFRIVVPGQEGGIEYKHQLVNPITKAIEVYNAIEAYSIMRESVVRHPLYETNFNTKVPTGICRFHAGEWPSTIPSQAILEGSIECLPNESIHEVKAAFSRYLQEWSAKDVWFKDHPLHLEWFGLWFDAAEIAPDHPMVVMLAETAEDVTGQPVRITGAGGVRPASAGTLWKYTRCAVRTPGSDDPQHR
ncbi:ArgE/DapE family deacylase [Geitlerinema splendidum]|nr:ArgE/DapE family deacylase [Geitlerinema splendidum]